MSCLDPPLWLKVVFTLGCSALSSPSGAQQDPRPTAAPPVVIDPARIVYAEKARPAWLPPQIVQTYGSHQFLVGKDITSIAFSRDGRLVAIGVSRDWRASTVTVWDREGMQLAHFVVPSSVSAVGFCLDDTRLVALAAPHRSYDPPPDAPALYAWSVPGYKPLSVPRDIARKCELMAVSPKGRLLAVATRPAILESDLSDVSLINPTDWQVVATWRCPGLHDIAFSPDGAELALASRECVFFRRVDPPTPLSQHAVKPYVQPGFAVADFPASTCLTYFPDGRRLAVSDADGVTIRDRKMKVLQKLRDRPERPPRGGEGSTWRAPVDALAASPDGRTVYCAGEFASFKVQAFDVESGRERWVQTAVRTPRGLAISPDGRHLAVWGGTLACRADLIPLATEKSEVPALKTWAGGPAHISPDGRFVLATLGNGQTGVFDAHTAQCLHSLEDRLVVRAFDPAGRRLALAGPTNVVIYDVPGFKRHTTFPVKALEGLEGYRYVRGLAFSPDGAALFVSAFVMGGPSFVVKYRTADWQEVASARLRSDEVLGLRVSPDGALVAVATAEHRTDHWADIKVWETERLEPFRTIRCQFRPENKGAYYIRGLAFSPDSKLLAAGTSDGLAYVWEVGSGQERCRVEVGGRYSNVCVAFAPDGASLLVGSDTFTIRRLDAPGEPTLTLNLRFGLSSVARPLRNEHGTWTLLGCGHVTYLVKLPEPR